MKKLFKLKIAKDSFGDSYKFGLFLFGINIITWDYNIITGEIK